MCEFKKAIITTSAELIKKGSIVTIIGDCGDQKYRVRTKNGLSYTVNKKSCRSA